MVTSNVNTDRTRIRRIKSCVVTIYVDTAWIRIRRMKGLAGLNHVWRLLM